MSSKLVHFRKMNGLGNDFVVLDGRNYNLRLNSEAAALIGNRDAGIGCDQLILIEPSMKADVTMRIFNQDGSEVESCGNASRCIADILLAETQRGQVTIDTRGGLLSCTKAGDGLVTVDMGMPKFDWQDIPLAHPVEDTSQVPITVGELSHPSCVNVGNPHAIFWIDQINEIDLPTIGPLLECHPIFPQKANISIAQIQANDHISLRVWERGVGITKACGTAACAAAVAGARAQKTSRICTISLPGGDIQIEWDSNDHILMTGAVEYEYEGDLPIEMASMVLT